MADEVVEIFTLVALLMEIVVTSGSIKEEVTAGVKHTSSVEETISAGEEMWVSLSSSSKPQNILSAPLLSKFVPIMVSLVPPSAFPKLGVTELITDGSKKAKAWGG